MKLVWFTFLAGLLAGCANHLTHDQEILAWNGVHRQGFMVGADDVPIGVYSAEVFPFANKTLEEELHEITGERSSECLLVPKLSGYDVVVLSHQQLTPEMISEIGSLVDRALASAEKQVEPLRSRE